MEEILSVGVTEALEWCFNFSGGNHDSFQCAYLIEKYLPTVSVNIRGPLTPINDPSLLLDLWVKIIRNIKE